MRIPIMVNSFSPHMEKISTCREMVSFNWCSHLMGGCHIARNHQNELRGQRSIKLLKEINIHCCNQTFGKKTHGIFHIWGILIVQMRGILHLKRITSSPHLEKMSPILGLILYVDRNIYPQTMHW